MFTKISAVKNWSDLQEKVRILFEELGYTAKTNQTVALGNGGKADVDVFAEKGKSALSQKILFECKYWETDIPRAIVQSFKMDVQEAGANFGIIVAKNGFQSGAFEGVTLTTVRLYTFEELQTQVAEEWFANNILPLDREFEILQFESRAFEFGTPERAHFESCLFNAALKAFRNRLEPATLKAIALYKDYRPADALCEIDSVEMTIEGLAPSECSVSFTDARTFSKAMKRIFRSVRALWDEFKHLYGEELLKLPLDMQVKVLGGRSPEPKEDEG